MNNAGIYIHVPWCKRRCPYCDFYLEVGKPDTRFVQAIKAQWRVRKESYVDLGASLYFGGGTPSLLAAKEINELIQFFDQEGALGSDAEITLEANPEDLTQAFIKDLKQTRVNRLSLGVQSFNDEILKFLGRGHTGEQAQKAIVDLKNAGFKAISVDFIIGVQGESPTQILSDLDFLIKHDIPHISAYLLTIEQKTRFFKAIEQKKMQALDEDAQADIFCTVQEKLKSRGYEQYDISSYARNKQYSRHNQIYWGMGDYLGLGPSAHSMRKLPDGGKVRSQNEANLTSWLTDPGNETKTTLEILDKHSALLESLAFGLRNMVVGIDPPRLALLHDAPLPQDLALVLKKLIDLGWLEEQLGVYRITALGALFADAIMRDILCL